MTGASAPADGAGAAAVAGMSIMMRSPADAAWSLSRPFQAQFARGLSPRQRRVDIVAAQQPGGEAHGGLLLGAAAAVAQRDLPQGGDDADAVLQRHPLLDAAGQADGIGGLGLDHLGGGALLAGLGMGEAGPPGQDGLDAVLLVLGIAVVGARHPDQ